MLERIKDWKISPLLVGIILLVYGFIQELTSDWIANQVAERAANTIKAVFAVTLTVFVKLIIKFITKTILKKGGATKMEKFKVAKKALLKLVRENWQTGLGLVSFVYLIFEASFNWLYTSLIANGFSAYLATAVLMPLIGLVANAMAKNGLEFGKTFSLRKEVTDKQTLAKKIEKAKTKLQETEKPVKVTAKQKRLDKQAVIDNLAKAELAKTPVPPVV